MSVTPSTDKSAQEGIITPFSTGKNNSYMDGDETIRLPSNIYTMSILFWLISDEKCIQQKGCGVGKMCEYWATAAQCLFTLGTHYTVLGFLTYYLVTLEYEIQPSEYFAADWLLLATCLSVFSAFMLQEYAESWLMFKWILLVPPAPRVQNFRTKYNKKKERFEIYSTMPNWAKCLTMCYTVIPNDLCRDLAVLWVQAGDFQ